MWELKGSVSNLYGCEKHLFLGHVEISSKDHKFAFLFPSNVQTCCQVMHADGFALVTGAGIKVNSNDFATWLEQQVEASRGEPTQLPLQSNLSF